MYIRKEYNTQELINQLKEEVDRERQFKGVVILSSAMAQDILDVLQETYRREQKHQTIESVLTFEESEIPSCFGKYETDDKEDCTCVFCEYELNCKKETERKKKKRRPVCFNVTMSGNFEACKNCEYYSDCVHEVKNKKNKERT